MRAGCDSPSAAARPRRKEAVAAAQEGGSGDFNEVTLVTVGRSEICQDLMRTGCELLEKWQPQ